MDEQAANRALFRALQEQGQRLDRSFHAALRAGDRETAMRLGGEMATLAGQVVALRLALGAEPGALLELLQRSAAELGLDLRGILPGGRQC